MTFAQRPFSLWERCRGGATALAMTIAMALVGYWLSGRLKAAALPVLGRVPDFRLTAVTAASRGSLEAQGLAGRPWVADFIFTSCAGPCPALSLRMSRLQAVLPARVRLVSFTVDPDHDDARVLGEYARRFKADPKRWYFVRGPKAGLYPLLRDGFHVAAVEDAAAPSGYRVTHSTKFVLVDGKMDIRGYYDGQDERSIQRLEHDAALLAR